MKITVDKKQVKGGFKHFWEKSVGTGYAPLALREDYRQHLRTARKELGFEYARFHGIFHDNMGVYDEEEDGSPLYNWSYVDKVYDFLVDIGMKPFVELGFMPEKLASGSNLVFWWKGNVSPPKDYDKWYGLVHAFTQHLIERYGYEEVKTWRFEVWNEPNLKYFWGGTQEEYFKLYEYSVKAIKAVNKDLKVGGPAVAGGNGVSWVEDFINFCNSQKIPFDFISGHCYEVGRAYQDGVVKRSAKVKDRILTSVTKIKEIMNTLDVQTEFHYTEWGSCTALFDVIQDMEYQAPFILKTIKSVSDMGLDSFSYWTHSDVFEEQGVNRYPFRNGFGLINMQGLKKAAFNTFVMMKMLGDNELVVDYQNGIATTSDNGKNMQIVLWNYVPFKELEDHHQFAYDESAADTLEISLKNAEGTYRLEKYQIDKHHSNVFEKWVEAGEPRYPNKVQMELLEKNSHLELVEEKIFEIKGETQIQIEVPACGAVLLKLVLMEDEDMEAKIDNK